MLRDQLLADVAALRNDEGAALWAYRALPAKNSLTDADARQVEEAFQLKLAGFSVAADQAEEPDKSEPEPVAADQEGIPSPGPEPTDVVSVRPASTPDEGPRQQGGRKRQSRKRGQPREPDASRLTLDGALPFALTNGDEAAANDATAPRIDKADLTLSEPRRHRNRDHLKFVRVSDEFTVPLCRLHHRALHRRGDEAAWWAEQQLEPLPVAQKLWSHTRGNGFGFPPAAAIGPAR